MNTRASWCSKCDKGCDGGLLPGLGALMALVLTMWAMPASASLYCVSATNGLQTVLDSAGLNAQDDEFRFRSGTIAVTQQLIFNVLDAHSVSLSGGWGPACNAQDGAETLLDGQGTNGILLVNAFSGANVAVRRITFENAAGDYANAGGALQVDAAGDLVIELCRFFVNSHTDGGGAVAAAAYGTMSIRNNLFFANRARQYGAAEFLANGAAAYITSNTIVTNFATDVGPYGGIYLAGSAHFTLANNLIWGNSGADVNNTGVATLLNNDVEIFAGNAPDAGSSHNLALAPVYASGLFNFHQASSSPLVNVGIDNPPGGLTSVDLSAATRLQPPHVDIGAYETDVIFYGGFE